MPQPTKSSSYDDIVRKNVPLPDSSYRPTDDEAVDAEVPREPTLVGPNQEAMRDALQALGGVDVADLQVDVDGGTATMLGSVARDSDREQIMATLRQVPGVVAVIDRLRIRLE